MCEKLGESEEGLLYADIDLGAIAVAKSFADPVGHYSRPDVTRLLLNRSARSPVEDASAESWGAVTLDTPGSETGDEDL